MRYAWQEAWNRLVVISLICSVSIDITSATLLKDDAQSQQRLQHNDDIAFAPTLQPGLQQSTLPLSSAGEQTLQLLRESIAVLQDTWFELWLGTWPSAIDWTGAVLNTHLVATLSTLSRSQERVSNESITIEDSNNVSIAQDVNEEINVYFAQSTAYYFGEDAFAIRNEAFDDMLWVVLSWLESVKFIQAHSHRHYRNITAWHGDQFSSVFAHRARVFWNLTTSGWSTDLCGGGMNWNPAFEPYKNAITNQLFISASIGMYLDYPGDENESPFTLSSRRHDPIFLRYAVDAYKWLKLSNMTNRQALFVDGFHIRHWNQNGTGGKVCNDRNEMVYTYNQGVVLSGLRGLWEATGNSSYLEDGHQLVQSTISATGWLLTRQTTRKQACIQKTCQNNDACPEDACSQYDTWSGLGRAGVMEEFCDARGTCDQNAHTFKSIYFHHLALFCEPLPRTSRHPGVSRAADDSLYQWHLQACQSYISWVAHNAQAALSTRDSKGRIGTWWNAGRVNTLSTRIPLPPGAVDYRNSMNKHDTLRWTRRIDGASRGHDSPRRRPPSHSNPLHDADWNDRGRGRTVESHAGGVALLRCLWQLTYLE